MSEMGQAMMGSGVATGEDRAEEAAEAAISHSLLEDIDLAGARGVLVNITAGIDMRLDEFEIVGNTVKAFASDNATVVIGTSLDPDMTDEFRVTVVATGIGNEKKPEMTLVTGSKPKVAEPVAAEVAVKAQAEPEIAVKPAATASVVAASAGHSTSAAQKPAKASQTESAYLDIPAFLRKQAD
jgi:cell division protein FtsZ